MNAQIKGFEITEARAKSAVILAAILAPLHALYFGAPGSTTFAIIVNSILTVVLSRRAFGRSKTAIVVYYVILSAYLVLVSLTIQTFLVYAVSWLSFFAAMRQAELSDRFSAREKDLSSGPGLDRPDEHGRQILPVYGIAGKHIAKQKFDDGADTAAIGARGEIAVGKALEDFACRTKGVSVFHSICFTPGKHGADIDHVVVIGKRIFFVDAKWYQYGDYSWADNRLTLNGRPFVGSNNNMKAAIEKWEKHLGSYSPMAVITLAKPDSSKYGINNRHAPSTVKLATLNGLINELETVAKHEGWQDPYLINRLRQNLM